MKTCPDCAEEVQEAARVCRYCGYRFDSEIEERLAPRQRSFLEIMGLRAPSEEDREYDQAVSEGHTVRVPVREDENPSGGLIAAGFVLLAISFIVPFVAIVPFIIGIVLLTRNEVGYGLGMMVAAMLIFGLRLYFYASCDGQAAFC